MEGDVSVFLIVSAKAYFVVHVCLLQLCEADQGGPLLTETGP